MKIRFKFKIAHEAPHVSGFSTQLQGGACQM